MTGKTRRKGFLGNERLSHQYARDGCSFKAWVGSAGNFFRSDLVASLLGKSKPKKKNMVNSPFLREQSPEKAGGIITGFSKS